MTPIASHLIQSTLFATVASLLTLAFQKNRAQIRYALWLSASVKFLIPFSLLIAAGSHFGISYTTVVTAAPALSSVIEQIAEPFAAPTPFPAPRPAQAVGYPAILGTIWIIGFAFVLSNWYRRWRNLRAALRSATPLQLNIGIPVMTSPNFPEPGVYGIFRPILLLPAGITDQLAPAQLKSILDHELCHIRRRDNLATTIHMTVEAIFWFHPLVWWLGARLMEERERACDEEVLRQGNEPQTYAEAILKICELYLESPLPCIAGVTGANLKHRIEAIMANRIPFRLNLSRRIALAAAGTAALAGPILIGAMIGIGHLPALRAQSPIAVPSLAQTLAQIPIARPSRANSAPPSARQPVLTATPPQHLDVQTSYSRALAPNAANALVVNGTLPRVFAPYGLSEDEYSRRLAWVDANLGPRQTPLHQIVLRYGPPDRIDAANWRYNSLAVYHGALELELSGATKGFRILSPPPSATRESAAGDTTLSAPMANTLTILSRRNGQADPIPAGVHAGFPGPHASMQIYPAGALSVLSLPLDSLSGQLDIVGEIRLRDNPNSPVIRSIAGITQASAGAWSDAVFLDAGSFVCDLAVKEAATGRIYKETISFDVR